MQKWIKQNWPSVLAFAAAAGLTATGVWEVTGSGWWTLLVALLGAMLVTAVLRYLYRRGKKALERRRS